MRIPLGEASESDHHRDHLFTFLDKPRVPFNNNHAERQIRPAVIVRKNLLCNRSTKGAKGPAIGTASEAQVASIVYNELLYS
jgi:hypothetical protein